jgi:hypothetical protein
LCFISVGQLQEWGPDKNARKFRFAGNIHPLEISTMPLTTDPKVLGLSRNVIKVFDKADRGPRAGFRPAHAKEILLTGEFRPSTEAVSLTRAPHVQRASVRVTVRFSDFAGSPTVADNDPQNASPQGLAVRFQLAEHVHADIVAHSVDSFPARTAEEFLEFISALSALDPAGPHPNAIEQFLESKHRVTVGGFLRNRLANVPVLDDLAILQPKDVDTGHPALAG